MELEISWVLRRLVRRLVLVLVLVLPEQVLHLLEVSRPAELVLEQVPEQVPAPEQAC